MYICVVAQLKTEHDQWGNVLLQFTQESTGSELSGEKNLNYKLRITLDSERKDNYLMKRNNSLKTFNFRKQNIQKC